MLTYDTAHCLNRHTV